MAPILKRCMERRLLYRIPIVNFGYETLFDDPPTMEQINNLMTAFALMDALLITMAGALMNVLDKDQAAEMRDAVAGFTQDVDITLLSGEVIDPYNRFLRYSCLSFDFITGALFTVFLLYLGMGTISFQNRYGKDCKTGYASWWAWSRWLFVVLIVMTAVGTAFLVIATCYAWAMQHAETGQDLHDLIWWSDLGNYIFLALIGAVFPVVMLSMALIWRESAVDRYNDSTCFEEESVDQLVLFIGSKAGIEEATLQPIIAKLKEEHWLKTGADLLDLSEDAWVRLELPLKLETLLREELDSEDPAVHKARMAVTKEPSVRDLATGEAKVNGKVIATSTV